MKKCEEDKKFNDERPLKKEDILDGILPLDFAFQAYKVRDNERENIEIPFSLFDDGYGGLICFFVNYNEFVEGVNKLQYNIHQKTFDELAQNISRTRDDVFCNITIDLTQENKHIL